MKQSSIYLVFLFVLSLGCKTPEGTKTQKTVDLPVLIVKPSEEKYNASRTRTYDIVHTKLDVSFDWNKKHLLGKANITAHPYFYPTSNVEFDARGFDIHEVAMVRNERKYPATYTYDGEMLKINLDREYKRTENFEIFVDYTAKPDELPEGGNAAITSDKGLYFINPDGSDKNKPKQIWTQGETTSNSTWFPTFDSPNERMSVDMYMTVDTNYVTLSNGTLVYSNLNSNGTRTDYWKQELPHAPYLVMMAIGEYAVVKDTWRGKTVGYYVEPAFKKDARGIFSNTPEMLEFFSNILKYEYPWDKYSQVIVRDYVSGAMENTGAVIYGEFVQLTEREMLDGNGEETVAHELFHHWFGDLVTCESWANIPLNESFATYGEYLWNEHKYGPEKADMGLNNDLRNYLNEAQHKREPLIRYGYENEGDVFDSHSYQKGGRVLHMLRTQIGDDAFFSALNLYLTKNKFSSVEIHNLRLAVEEVTGEDFNWFFNQWFLNAGHPELEINWSYADSTKKEIVTIEQKQDLGKYPLFKLPLAIDIYSGGQVKRHNVILTKQKEVLEFDVVDKPRLVNFDAQKVLLGTKKENKSKEELVYQYANGQLYMDRYEAIEGIGGNYSTTSPSAEMIMNALSDPFYGIRLIAIKNIDPLGKNKEEKLRLKLMEMAQLDEKTSVRAAAIKALAKYYSDEELIRLYQVATKDQSYSVLTAALEAYHKAQPDEALSICHEFESETSGKVLNTIAAIYAKSGAPELNTFYNNTFEKIGGFDMYGFVNSYGKYLSNASDETRMKGVTKIGEVARTGEPWFIRMSAMQALNDLSDKYKEIENEAKEKSKIPGAAAEADQAAKKRKTIDDLIADIKKNETNNNLKKMYGTE